MIILFGTNASQKSSMNISNDTVYNWKMKCRYIDENVEALATMEIVIFTTSGATSLKKISNMTTFPF